MLTRTFSLIIFWLVTTIYLTHHSQAQVNTQMERLQFNISIEASPEIVYRVIIDSDHFQEWTKPFGPTSYFEGTWEPGSTMRFLSKDENGKIMGMLSKVRENRANTYIGLEHFGYIRDGKEITEGEDIETIKGARENYTLLEEGGGTKLLVESDTFSEYKEYFLEAWPKALEKVRAICEE